MTVRIFHKYTDMIQNKCYILRLYPNDSQMYLINKTFGCCRLVYNLMLNDKNIYYKETKQNKKVSPNDYKENREYTGYPVLLGCDEDGSWEIVCFGQ